MVFGDFPMATNSCETCVYWDVEDSSILNDLNPYVMFADIKSALKNKGYCIDNLLIRAYIDENFNLSEEFTEIYQPIIFIPQGNRYRRVNVMLVNTLINALRQKNVVILSKNIQEDEQFSSVRKKWEKYGFNVVIQPFENLLGESLSGFGKQKNCDYAEPVTQRRQDGAGRGLPGRENRAGRGNRGGRG